MLVKADQNNVNYTFKGGIGLAPQYKTQGCDRDCTEELSACLMAHVNTTGVHIPLWLDSPMSQIGWGQVAPSTRCRRARFFRPALRDQLEQQPRCVLLATVRRFASDEVPGRLGSDQGAVPYAQRLSDDGGHGRPLRDVRALHDGFLG